MPNPRPETVGSITVQRPVSASLRVYYADGSDKPAAPDDLAQFGFYPVFKAPTWTGITVDVSSGVSIHAAAVEVATLAVITDTRVRFEFNGTTLTVDPDQSAADIVAAYHEYRRAAEAERAAEKGVAHDG